MTNRNDKLKKKSNSVRLKWQVSRFLSIKQTLQSPRGGKWRQSNLTGLFHHIKSLFGPNLFPFVWLQVISIFTSFLPTFGDFLGENTCLFPVLLMPFTWTVVNHQGRLEMHARICTGGPKTKLRGFHRLWPGCVSIVYLHLLQRWLFLQETLRVTQSLKN